MTELSSTPAPLDAVTLAKKAAAEYAVDHAVESGMRIGLGTGSTAVWAVRRVGALLAGGQLRDVVAVPTSNATGLSRRQRGRYSDPRLTDRAQFICAVSCGVLRL